jgi:hypothetical protein
MADITEPGIRVKRDGLAGGTAQASSIMMEPSGISDAEEGKPEVSNKNEYDWNQDPHNPYNWPSKRKAMQVAIIASVGFLTYVMHAPSQGAY